MKPDALDIDDREPEPPNTFHNEEELVAMLREGLDGEPVPVTDETWAELERRIRTHPNPKL